MSNHAFRARAGQAGRASMTKSRTRSSLKLEAGRVPGSALGHGRGKSAVGDAEKRVDQPAIQWR